MVFSSKTRDDYTQQVGLGFGSKSVFSRPTPHSTNLEVVVLASWQTYLISVYEFDTGIRIHNITMQATCGLPRITKNYRVPSELRAIKQEAYTPQMFLIGPLHQDKSDLQYMEKEKQRYMSDFFDRVAAQDMKQKQKYGETSENCSKQLTCDRYRRVVSEFEVYAREWYTEDIDLDKHQLVEMLLLDVCFILELFHKCKLVTIPTSRVQYPPIDPLSGNFRILQTLRNDLMLLENQIPFVVLQKLFDLIPQKASIGDPEMSLQGYILWFFNSVPMLQHNISNSEDGSYRHLLDMLLDHVCGDTAINLPPMFSSNEGNCGFKRSATELYKSGVKFICGHNGAMVDIKFNEGELSIPQVIIDKASETLLRNFIALEQVSCRGHRVTSYVKVISSLIRSPEDANLLERLGIISIKSDVKMGAPALFESLCREVVFGDFLFTELCKEVNDYHIPVWRWRRLKGYVKIKRVEWKKSVKDMKFLPTPSVILPALQTFYTIRGYYNPPSH